MNLVRILQWYLRDATRPVPLALIVTAVIGVGLAFSGALNNPANEVWITPVVWVAVIWTVPIFILWVILRFLEIIAGTLYSAADLIDFLTGRRRGDGDGS